MLTVATLPIAAIGGNDQTAIDARLIQISPAMGHGTIYPGLVTARLNLWINDNIARVFTDWDNAASSALRSLSIDGLLWVPPGGGAALRTNAETEAGAPAFRTFMRDISRSFANCGQVTDEIRNRLTNRFGAVIAPNGAQQVFNAANANNIAAWLGALPPVGTVYLNSCMLGAIHLCVVEVPTYGNASLIQGYQGGYSAVWWLSQTPIDIVNGQPVTGLDAMRLAWGGMAAINAANLGALVDTYVANPTQNHWQALPFNPLQQPPRDANPLTFVCQRYDLTNPAAVYMAIAAVAPQSLGGHALLTNLP